MSTETTLSLDEQVAIEVVGGLIFKDGIHGADAPPYSTSIEDAWQIVDEMEHRGWLCALLRRPNRKWIARFSIGVSTIVSGEAFMPSEAICLAALAAVRGEKERQT